MADNKLTDKMKDELKELKRENRKKEREKQKRLKVELEKVRMAEDSEVWQMITSVKTSINNQLKENKKTARYNIKTISAIPDYYEYQNPNDAKQKSNNKDEDWIKSFLSSGGTEKELLDTAKESRVKIWRRTTWKRPMKKTTTSTTTAKVKNQTGAGGVG
jgi:hypothetical protein